ncbi:MAG: IclR family transcriptional regulator [Actinobacteria bacterium]|nr:IclR family transcriptional regulator [Actinomycetota bacterium]
MLGAVSTSWIGILPSVPTRSAVRAEIDGRPEASVGVLAKAVRVLDLLAGRREASAAELADTLGEPRSSVHRLLTALAELDLVEPGSQRGTYRLGLKLLRLGTAVIARLDVRLAAMPVMERIHDDTEETVFLCLRRGRDAVCIERIDGRRAAVMDLKLGGSLPIHEGSGPRSLLAFAPRSEWDAYIQGNSLYDSQTDSELAPEDLIASLEEARRVGAVVNRDVFPPGFATIGAPIYDHRGEPFAALSVSGVRDAILGDNEARVFQMVTSGAHEISRALGYDRVHEQSAVRHRVAD